MYIVVRGINFALLYAAEFRKRFAVKIFKYN